MIMGVCVLKEKHQRRFPNEGTNITHPCCRRWRRCSKSAISGRSVYARLQSPASIDYMPWQRKEGKSDTWGQCHAPGPVRIIFSPFLLPLADHFYGTFYG